MLRYLLSIFGIFFKTSDWIRSVFILNHLSAEEKTMWYLMKGTSKEDRERMERM